MAFLEFEPPENLKHPALIATFRGWSDGGESASTAGNWLREHLDGRRFARIDPEQFYDFTVHRPIVRLVDGIYRTLEWPSSEFFHARSAERDLILLVGTEPNLKWTTFTQLILDLSKQLGIEILVTLGAFLAPVPHNREVGIMGTAADLEQAMSLGLTTSRYQGPTGITGALQVAAREAGLPAASLWAAVPHYLAEIGYPKAAVALLERASSLLRFSIDTTTLDETQRSWERRVADMINDSPELAQYVDMLEKRIGVEAEEEETADRMEVPSGDELAEELEKFLRDQRDK